MQESSVPLRTDYRPSGKVNWLRFFPGLLLATGMSILMALTLFIAFQFGFYMIVFAPMGAGLAAAAVWGLILRWTHCRNRTIATFYSILLSLVVYLGYFHLGVIQMVGLQNAHRVDLLPFYIQFRMQTDVVSDAKDFKRDVAGPQDPNLIREIFNWLWFTVEFLLICSLFISIGRKSASNAYCERCQQWMKAEMLSLLTGFAALLWEALRQGKFETVRACLLQTTTRHPRVCSILINYCPHCAGSEASQVYLTVNDVPRPEVADLVLAKSTSQVKLKTAPGIRKIANQAALTPAEISALSPTFPVLCKTLISHPELLADVHRVVEEKERALASQVTDWKRAMAHIETINEPSAGTILTTKNALIQTLIAIISAVSSFVIAFIPFGLVCGLVNNPTDWMIGIAVGWMAFSIIFGLVWNLYYPNFLTAQFRLRQTRKAFLKRSGVAVDLRNPKIIFVDIVPRANWGLSFMENAEEIGFLEVDLKRQELIFEGDRERCWIPADSILEVKHESFSDPASQAHQSAPALNHLITVCAMTEQGPWEFCFYRRHHTLRRRTANRKLTDSLELEAEIRQLLPQSETPQKM